MNNVVTFKRPEADGIDATLMATMPMPEVYAAVMCNVSNPSTAPAVIAVLRAVARILIGSVTGEGGRPPAAIGLTNDAALRRACDLLDLATELEQGGEHPAIDRGA